MISLLELAPRGLVHALPESLSLESTSAEPRLTLVLYDDEHAARDAVSGWLNAGWEFVTARPHGPGPDAAWEVWLRPQPTAVATARA